MKSANSISFAIVTVLSVLVGIGVGGIASTAGASRQNTTHPSTSVETHAAISTVDAESSKTTSPSETASTVTAWFTSAIAFLTLMAVLAYFEANANTIVTQRAYLSAEFEGAVYQDAEHMFEVRITLANNGNTAAKNITIKATAEILDVAVLPQFGFHLSPDSAGNSVSYMAPKTKKFFTRNVGKRVDDSLAKEIKYGLGRQCLATWGRIDYVDSFGQPRFVRFAQTVHWQRHLIDPAKDLPKTFDMAGHNDGN